MAANFHRTAILISTIICNIANAQDVSASQKVIAERGLEFGLAFGELVYFASAQSKLPPADYRGTNSAAALDALRTNYTNQYAVQRASVKVLDKSLDLALGAGLVMTGGLPAILAGSTLGYVKTKSIGLLSNEIDRNARIFLATNITKFNKDNGNDYGTLRASGDPEEIKRAIDSTGLLSEFSATLGDDKVAIETVQTAVVRNILNTQKATLDSLAVTNDEISNAKTKLTKVAKDLSSYSIRVDGAVNDLRKSADDLAIAMDLSQKAIDNLSTRTDQNSSDLRIVGDVLFSQSSPSQKLALLQSNFYGDIDSETKKDLVTQLNGEIRKEQFVHQVQNVVGTINSISTIAKNLNVNISPEVNQAINFGNVASQAITAYVSGNPLGAVAAVSGLLGGGMSDPAEARQAALMSYLAKEFATINRKLDDIYDLQVQTLNAIKRLSDDIAKLQLQMHSRFDALSYEVETIQITTRALLFDGINHCSILRDQWRSQVPALRSKNIPTLNDLFLLAPLSSYPEVEQCLISLRSLFSLATTRYSDFSQNPLASRLSGLASNSLFPVPTNNDLAEYRSEVQLFDEENFKPSYHLAVELNTDDDISSAGLLWSFSNPARSAEVLKNKIDLLKKNKGTCFSGTMQSKPTIDLLCSLKQDSAISFEQLPNVARTADEDQANLRARVLLRNGMIQEPLTDLVELALFFSAVAETQDPATAKRLTTPKSLLSKNRVAQGPYILANALKTTTLATAQGGMLYGDYTSFSIFKLLWSQANNRYLNIDEINSDEKLKNERLSALKLLKNNPYLAKNVLMIALNESIGERKSGENIAYRFGLSELTKSGEGAQLNLFFKNEIPFTLIKNSPCGDSCSSRGMATIVDILCPLPTWSEFESRKLDYPPVVSQVQMLSDLLAHRLASYDIARITYDNSKISLYDQAIVLTTFGNVESLEK